MNGKIRKKILYIITKSNFGGAQRYVFELATSLPKEDFEVVVAAGGNGLLFEKLRSENIKTRQIKSFERDINLWKEFLSVVDLSRIIREERPDVIHLNSSKAGGSGAFIARLHGVRRIIFTAHGWPFFEKRNFLWKTLAWFFSWLTALLTHTTIVVSTHDLKDHRMPFVQKKMMLVHPGVPPIEFKELETARVALIPEAIVEKHEGDLWAVTTSEHNHNKNLHAALEAVRLYNIKNLQKVFLVITGEGELKHGLEEYVAVHGMQNSVFFTGYVDDVRSYLRAFDIFLLPSLKEGLPYSLLEAGSVGLFCIASNVGGMPDVIHHGSNGYLIDPYRPETIVAALEAYNPKVSPQEKVEAEFTLSKMVEKTKALYI